MSSRRRGGIRHGVMSMTILTAKLETIATRPPHASVTELNAAGSASKPPPTIRFYQRHGATRLGASSQRKAAETNAPGAFR